MCIRDSAYMLNLGLESLHVRMQRHCENGMAVAKFLEAQDVYKRQPQRSAKCAMCRCAPLIWAEWRR